MDVLKVVDSGDRARRCQSHKVRGTGEGSLRQEAAGWRPVSLTHRDSGVTKREQRPSPIPCPCPWRSSVLQEWDLVLGIQS